MDKQSITLFLESIGFVNKSNKEYFIFQRTIPQKWTGDCELEIYPKEKYDNKEDMLDDVWRQIYDYSYELAKSEIVDSI